MSNYLRLAVTLAIAVFAAALPARADVLRVMKTGLGSGTVSATGITCGADCDETYPSISVTLTAVADPGSVLVSWGGDCAGAVSTCTVNMSVARSVRAEFAMSVAIPLLVDFTPGGINTYLTANPVVTTAGRFLKALSQDFKQNWILMSRSESLQTGTADSPRILLPNNNAQRVFTIGMSQHSSYPGAHPNALEYMQWDPAQKNFRFHEIVLDAIPAIGVFPARARGVSADDAKCFACHSTRNVLNRGTTPGTDGIPPGTVKWKNKPNWDTYDSWGGMLPFNRDRIYQGSAEAAAFRKLLNVWTWRTNPAMRAVVEQLELQPPGVTAAHSITRTTGGANDGHINFGFDVSPPVLTEPAPAGSVASITTNYSFNGVAGTGAATTVLRGGTFVTLHDSVNPTSDEGRGVQLFDLVGGLDGNLNQLRIADELINHRFATGSVPIDVRAIALAITQGCIVVDGGTAITDTQTLRTAMGPTLPSNLSFFDTRHGVSNFNQVYDDTRLRAWNLPRRKADIQKINLDRTIDPYAFDSNTGAAPPPPGIINGLIQLYGAATSAGMSTGLDRIRQEVFRRFIDNPGPDNTVMGGIYVDRELITNTEPVALFRYFLEPLGVSVDKWSMGVRGRSRTYTFADVFGAYLSTFATELKASLGISAAALPAAVCSTVMPTVNTMIAALPAASEVPKYTDIQRIFNKGCIECHGGLDYPPYSTYGSFLDLSEDENPPAGARRMARSHGMAMTFTSAPAGTDVSNSYLYRRITNSGALAMPYDPVGTNENCPNGVMPCGGPPLSKVDIETIKRWIIGGRAYTEGDPHIKTVDGTNYDFQGAGEFVLLRDENLEIQSRQSAVTTAGPLAPDSHTGLSSCVSVNTAFALRVGPHRVSYQPEVRAGGIERGTDGPTRLVLRIDGKVTELAPNIPLPSGGRIVRTSANGGIQVEYPGGTIVIVTPAWWPSHQIWYMNINVHHARATEGVMGVIAPGNWLPALPDGSFMGPRPASLAQRHVDLYEKFADAWRVTPATSLFDYEPGLSPASFTVDTWPVDAAKSCIAPSQPGVPAMTTALAQVAPAEAEKLCSGITSPDRRAHCVQDVIATGERSFAETYAITERLDNRSMPPMPTLESPADNAELSASSTFTWRASEADGKPLTYRHCLWSAAQKYDLNQCGAIASDNTGRRAMMSGGIAALIGLLLLLLLFSRVRYRWALVAAVLIAVAAAVLVPLTVSRSTVASTTVARLEPGGIYFWKVVAENDEGRTVESPTRRFTVLP
jgi:hypothetical protein